MNYQSFHQDFSTLCLQTNVKHGTAVQNGWSYRALPNSSRLKAKELTAIPNVKQWAISMTKRKRFAPIGNYRPFYL